MDTEFRKPKFKWHVFYTRLIPLVRNVDILWNSLHSEFKREKTGQQQQMPWHSVVAHEFFELPPNCCRHRSVVCIVCIWEFLESGFWILCVVYFVCCRGRRPSPVAAIIVLVKTFKVNFYTWFRVQCVSQCTKHEHIFQTHLFVLSFLAARFFFSVSLLILFSLCWYNIEILLIKH